MILLTALHVGQHGTRGIRGLGYGRYPWKWELSVYSITDDQRTPYADNDDGRVL
jgi:hypothetical protein